MTETKELPPMMQPEEVWHWFDEHGNHQLGVKAIVDGDTLTLSDGIPKSAWENGGPGLLVFRGDKQPKPDRVLMQDRYSPRLLRWVHVDKLTRYYGDNPPKNQPET